MAGEVLMNISKDERERAIFRSRRIALADCESDRVTLEKVGIKSVARNAIIMGMDTDTIVKLTNLTHAEVENLRDAD